MHKKRVLHTSISLILAAVVAHAPLLAAQTSKDSKPPASAGSIDAATGKLLTEAIEFLNAENYAAAKASMAKIKVDSLSPYERSKTEQIWASIAAAQDDYGTARKHLQAAISAGGLNQNEVADTRYQLAQMFMAEDKWQEGAAALEEWFRVAKEPNSAAYYLLAVAYYQQNQLQRALPNAEKAVAMSEKPQESWIQLVVALYLQQEQYSKALPVLKQLVASAPDKKNYWLQLSSVYGQLEDFEKSLAVMQMGYNAGLLTDDSDIRRLTDLQLYNTLPYRCATTLEDAIKKNQVKVDLKLYEKQANCWIAAREFAKAVTPLKKAADMSASGDLYVRLGEVEVQRSEWKAAVSALQNGLRKGKLKDTGNAQILLGIANFNLKDYKAAQQAFNQAKNFDKHKKMADGYLQLIKAQTS
ncbi:MAG: tetratricopeptide repeat protein [Porticoccaceae bacterium]